MKAGVTTTAYHAGRHCAGPELLAPTSECPLCGFSGQRKATLRIQTDPDINLLSCPNCKGVSASQMPKPEVLADYYASYRQDTDLKVTFFSPAKFAGHILDLAKNLWNQDFVRILDFGGGDGSLAVAIADRLVSGEHPEAGKRVTKPTSVAVDVIDYSQQPTGARNKSVSVRQLSSLDETTTGTYDLAIASSVMEHIPEPNPTFRALFDSLKQGGYFYARTPFVVPFLRILERFGLNFDFTFPAHVHDMGKELWEGLAPRLLGQNSRVQLRHSHPSPVETTFKQDPVRTIAAHLLKLPWNLAPNKYDLVGGWEVLFERTT